jgi:hypothetical protein
MPGGEAPSEGFEITVDREGRWFYRGAEIVHREIVHLFCRHLIRDEQGGYRIRWRGQECPVGVEDTPVVVWGTSTLRDEQGDRGILLHLSDGTEEILDPSTFRIGPENVPYCRLGGRSFPARFSRKAYYQVARMVEEDPEGGAFSLRIGSQRYPISVDAP